MFTFKHGRWSRMMRVVRGVVGVVAAAVMAVAVASPAPALAQTVPAPVGGIVRASMWISQREVPLMPLLVVTPGQGHTVLSRADMAVSLGELLEWHPEAGTPGTVYADQATIPPGDGGYVMRARSLHIMRGVWGNLFAPGAPATWATAAEVVARTFVITRVPRESVASILSQVSEGARTPVWARRGTAADITAGLFAGSLGAAYSPSQPIDVTDWVALLQRSFSLPGATSELVVPR